MGFHLNRGSYVGPGIFLVLMDYLKYILIKYLAFKQQI